MRATTGAPDWPCPRSVTEFEVDAGLERLHDEPSDCIVTLCRLSSSPGETTGAQMRLQRKGLMFEPQVTPKEIGTPEVMLSSPAEAISTAVVNAAMSSPFVESCPASCSFAEAVGRSPPFVSWPYVVPDAPWFL